MTTIYKFKAYYTDSGVGAVQDPAPTCRVINAADDSILADAQTPTASINMPGLYYYEYSGADGLDVVTRFATTDTGCDVKQLASYVYEKITTNLNADVAGVEAKVDIIDDLVDDLEPRLTAARAGYLDNLSAGAVALETSMTALQAWKATNLNTSGSGGTIIQYRGDTLSVAINGLGSLANRSKLYFTAKDNLNMTDLESAIQVEETTGLIRINGAAATAMSGSIVVTDEVVGNIVITVKSEEMAKIVPTNLLFDVQIVRTVGIPVTTLALGVLAIPGDVTRNTS